MTKKKLSFEDHMSELKDSLEKLDHNDLSLEEALKVYEKGIASYKNCSDALSEAKAKVQILVESAEKETFIDFEEGNLSDDI